MEWDLQFLKRCDDDDDVKAKRTILRLLNINETTYFYFTRQSLF
jgi:hypothetical protein